MVTQTRGGGQATQKLSFHEKLAGKGLTTDALLKKLKTLHNELAEMDQELVDIASLGQARKELISTSILLHKDRGVKAYAACCLADILRLYAPDAPYTQSELRDIFQFFFRQLLNGLKSADASYYNEYFHLLESLSTVKSVVLVCDLQNADELMVDIFRDFFALVRRDLAKKIEIFMADILVALIDECQSLPSDVLEVIMAQFLDKNPVRCPCIRFMYLHIPCYDSVWTSLLIVLQCKYAMLQRTNSSVMCANTSPISLFHIHRTKNSKTSEPPTTSSDNSTGLAHPFFIASCLS